MPIAHMNAAGWAKTVEQAEKLSRVPVLTHVVMGSFTPEEKPGSSGGTNFCVGDDGTATNSIQLKNGGIPYLRQYGRLMTEAVKQGRKKAVVSIAGFQPSDYRAMAMQVWDIGADVIEVNTGCPNAVEGGKHKDIASYSKEALGEIVAGMNTLSRGTGMVWWLKVSPMANPRDLEWIAEMVKESRCSALVATNTFPNISGYHPDGRPWLDVADNYGGMSGTALKPISLSNCRRYRELLPGFPIIGVGGIDSGKDVNDYVEYASVTGVQVGTAFFQNEDTRALNRIAEQYVSNYVPDFVPSLAEV